MNQTCDIERSPWSEGTCHTGGNGDVTCTVNTNQVVVARNLYDPVRNVLAKRGSHADANLYRFFSEGKEAHVDSGVAYHLYRFYDPVLRRQPNQDRTFAPAD